jgi:hypothetical protein
MLGTPQTPAGMDKTRPTPARIYDHMLRGDQILAAAPEIRDAAFSNRGFHQRAAKWIAEQGVHQFIDIGSGLPTVGNTHEVVQRVHSDARVVYTDNDPMVALHSTSIIQAPDRIAVVCGDLRDPDSVLGAPEQRQLIDPDQPTGLLITGVMFISDDDDPFGLVSGYVDAMPSGSYLSLSHLTDEHKPPAAAEGFRRVFDTATEHLYFRNKAEVARFFNGLELVPPREGASPEVTWTGIWGAEDAGLADSEGSRWLYCGVARVP